MRRLALAAVAALLLTTPAPAFTFWLFGLELTLPHLSNQLSRFEVMPGGYAEVCTPLGCKQLFPNIRQLELLPPPVMYEAGQRLALVYAIPYASFAELEAMADESRKKGLFVFFDLYLNGICMRRLEGPELCALTRADTLL